MVSKENVEAAEGLGWSIISGLPKSVKAVYYALEEDVPFKPETLVRYETTKIYAIESHIQLYGKERRIIIYKNSTRATNEADERNASLAEISEKLSELSKKGADWSEADLHKEIQKIVGCMKRFLKIRVKRKGESRIEFSYRQSILRNEEKRDGKWALLVTNPKTSVNDAVKAYLEKDFIEKGFRTMKTDAELEPVRHRLERRVRAYIFVQVLALKLRSTLRWLIENRGMGDRTGTWETSEELLRVLGRVERLEVTMGNSQRTWYLNLLQQTKERLKKIGYGGLFEN
jgi:transposase